MPSPFRSMRVRDRLTHSMLTTHPGYFARFVDIMWLGRKPIPALAFDVQDVSDLDLQGGWVQLASAKTLAGMDGPGADVIAANIPYPVRLREGDPPKSGPDNRPIVGYAVAGEARQGALWGLVVPMLQGETEVTPEFQERVRGAKQVHGLVPVT